MERRLPKGKWRRPLVAALESIRLISGKIADNVLPLDGRKTERLNVDNRPSLTAGRKTFTYPNLLRLPEGTAPDLKHKSHTITAKVELPEIGGEGMLLTQGGRFAAYGFYVRDGKLSLHTVGLRLTAIVYDPLRIRNRER
jgi:hypothetical protein